MFMNWWCRPTVLQEDNELYRRFWQSQKTLQQGRIQNLAKGGLAGAWSASL